MLRRKRKPPGRCQRQDPRRLRIEPLESRRVLAGQAVITEFLASNSGGFLDGDGNDSDWIELFNAGDATLDLANWYLTDDADNLTQWQFPDVDAAELAPGEFLVVFASGQPADDYIDGDGKLHTNFSLSAGGEYLALVGSDGTTVQSEFGLGGTDYPQQVENFSYGVGQETTITPLITQSTSAALLIPSSDDDAQIGSTWTGDGPFDTSGWTTVTAGVGFDNTSGGDPVDPPAAQTAADIYRQTVLDDSPVGYWRFDETGTPTVVADQSTSANPLTAGGLSNGDFGQPGVFPDASGTAVQLSDAKPDDMFSSDDPVEFGFVSGESFSVEYWIKVDSTNSSANGAGIITKGYDSAPATPWYLSRYSTNGRVDFLLRGGSDSFATSTSSINDGGWHQVVGVYDAATAESRLYVDGNLEATVTNVPPAAYGTNSRPLTIGNHLGRTLDANIDEVAIYDSALTAERIAAHYLAATTTPTTDPPVPTEKMLRIDFGSSANLGGGPGGTQNGYLPFEHTGTSTVTKTFASELGTASTVDVSLSGNTHWRDYDAATGQYADRSALLSDGPLCNASCAMTVTFEGLADGNYQLTTYNHTTRNGPSARPPATPFDVVLTDADRSAVTVVSGALMSDNASAMLSTQTIEFRVSGGNAVEVSFVRGANNGDGDHFALSGFDLVSTAPPSVGDLVETDIGDLMQDENASAYLRFPFDVSSDANFDFLTLDMQYDDGFVAYLNGTEVARRSAPGAAGAAPSFDAQATTENPTGPAIAEAINLSGMISLLRAGETNVLAIHGLNFDAADGDFLIRPQLTATSVTGNVSQYFESPTPGGPNEGGFVGFVSDTTFSVDRGLFDTSADAFDVEISTSTTGAQIAYTIDGSQPVVDQSGNVTNGMLYSGPINIDKTTTLRAVAFEPGFRTTNVDTQTYLFLDDVLDQSSSPPDGYPSTWGGTFTDWGLDQNEADLKAIAGDSNLSLDEAREVIKDSLRSLPTLSLVLDIDDVFGDSTGIYANTQGRGAAWERAASVEWIEPDGSQPGFQIDAGLRIQGFTSRDPNRNPKHSLRLIFRKEYGAGKLDFPLFGEEAATKFDTIVLRSNSQDAWVYDTDGNRQGTFVRDQWARETQLAMGQVSPNGTWVHLYINGLYWGVYNPTERPDASFNESYFGGDKDDYDSLKNHEEVLDGTGTAYRELLTLIQNDPNNFAAGYQDFSSDAAYQRVQGNNPDGTRNPDFPVYLDVENLIDYVVHNMYAAATDWPGNNYIGRDRTDDSEGFKFFDWDNEHGMKPDVTTNRTLEHRRDADSPTKFHHALRSNAEYRLLFADRLQQAFFNGGALYVDPANPQWDPANPDRNVPAARWMKISAEIEQSLIAEAARWGDVRGIQYTPNDQYLSLRNSLLADWFPQRSAIVLDQFRAQGLYPDTAAPVFSINGQPQHGGTATPGERLSMTVAAGQTVINTILIAEFSPATALVPSQADDQLIGDTWSQLGFVEGAAGETAWKSGNTGIGYENSTGYESLLGIDVAAEMFENQASVYARIPFSHDTANDFDQLTLKMKYDDGFVAYLNGTQVASSLAPAAVNWNSVATGQNTDTSAIVFQDFDITSFKNLLVDGTNILAIQGLNRSANSSDMLIDPELVGSVIDTTTAGLPVYYTTDGSDPRLSGGAISPTALLYEGEVALSQSSEINARTLSGDEWSALSAALFTVELPLRVTEIFYNPNQLIGAEFIELTNTGSSPLDLAGVRFVFSTSGDGIDYEFSSGENSAVLAAGDSIVVVQDRAEFDLAYPDLDESLIAVGEFTGSLSNGGEVITLLDAAGGTIQSFEYDDAWYPETDNQGFTLVVVSTSGGYDDSANWRSSAVLGGSPGVEDPESLAADFNGDGLADRRDTIVLLTGYAQASAANRTTGDADGDRATTLRDIALLQSVYTQPIAAPSPQAAEATLARVAVDAVFRSGRDSTARPIVARRRSRPVVDSTARLRVLQAEPIPSLSGDLFLQPRSRLTATRGRLIDLAFAESQLPGSVERD